MHKYSVSSYQSEATDSFGNLKICVDFGETTFGANLHLVREEKRSEAYAINRTAKKSVAETLLLRLDDKNSALTVTNRLCFDPFIPREGDMNHAAFACS